MKDSKVEKRMRDLMEPVDRQLMMCDNDEDLLMFNCAMLQRVFEVFDQTVGPDKCHVLILDHIQNRIRNLANNRNLDDEEDYE